MVTMLTGWRGADWNLGMPSIRLIERKQTDNSDDRAQIAPSLSDEEDFTHKL
jgi:hypothetical protein